MKKLNVFTENSCGAIDDVQELFTSANLKDIVKVLGKHMSPTGLVEMHIRTNLDAYILTLDTTTLKMLNEYKNDSIVLKVFLNKHKV